MPPKKAAKKGKKQDDDDAYWDAKAAALEAKSPLAAVDDEDDLPKSAAKGKKGKSVGAGSLYDLLGDDGVEDDGGGGGLMDTINASAAKKDKKKKKKNAFELDEEDIAEKPSQEAERANIDDEWPEDDVKPKKGKKDKKKNRKVEEDDEEEVQPEGIVDVNDSKVDDEWPEEDVKPKKGKKEKKSKKVQKEEEDEEMPEEKGAAEVEIAKVDENKLDDEWPEEDVKPKKGGKKGKKGKKQDDDEEFDLDKEIEKNKAAAAPKAEAVPEKSEDGVANEDDGEEGPTILTKAQKEKLKKEKEKAKKKAQAAAKKTTTTEPPAAEPEPTPVEPTPAAEAEDEDEGDEAAGGDKKKKKKKKPAAKAEPTPAPAAAPGKGGKKISAQVAAMQAAMLERQRIEEEAKRAEEERLRKIEEEEARIAAEEQRIAEQKAAKKAKEKEKAAKAKAEGRALTPAQKREKAAAEARKQAMLNSGMMVAGLQKSEGERKVSYAKKKPAKKEEKKEEKDNVASPEISTPDRKPVATIPDTIAVEKQVTLNGEDEDDWDKDDDEDAAAVEKVIDGMGKMKVEEDGDDWDKSSDEESPSKPTAKASTSTTNQPSISTPNTDKAGPTPSKAPVNGSAKPQVNGSAKPQSNGKTSGPAEESSDESSEEDSDDDDSDSDEETSESEDEDELRKQKALEKIRARAKAAQSAKSIEDLRSPICCILGHVDTGKTKLLDKIRQTSVQEGEAGGITQQIGATFFPKNAIQEKTAVVQNPDKPYDVKIPGLLIIDTPGHESFTNLRTRGSSLCNIAILVVDITHGLEPQTIESLNLLRNGKTPFIVALNKIDRMYGWKATPNGGFRDTLAQQSKSVKSEFEDRVKKTKLAFAEQGLNAEIFDENKDPGRTVSLVPTSAITGEGIPDMLMLLVKLTQERMNQALMYISELECTILEVKVIEGLGTTIDVVLSNGVMREGDRIVLCGTDGPIETTVRALLTPQPLRELRVKSAYVHHKEVKAALGVKISAPGLEKAIAGARLYVAKDEDEVLAYKEMAMEDLTSLGRFVEKSGKGVWVQASTLGSLEALLTFLQQMKIPVFNFGIGPIYKNTIVRAATMLEKAPEYAVILAFDVQIEKDAEELAKKAGMKVFSAMIIYHLFDAFKKYMEEVLEAKRQAALPNAVWPCKLKILKAFAHRDPIILGVDLMEGTLRIGTPMGVVKVDKESGKRDIVKLGKVTSIEINHKPFENVKKSQIGAGAAVKIERAPHEQARLYGRHFDDKDEVVSLLSRQSIDTLKLNFRDQVDISDWALIKKMKTEQGIP